MRRDPRAFTTRLFRWRDSATTRLSETKFLIHPGNSRETHEIQSDSPIQFHIQLQLVHRENIQTRHLTITRAETRNDDVARVSITRYERSTVLVNHN